MSSTVYMQSQVLETKAETQTQAEAEADLSLRDRVWSLFSRLNPFSSDASPPSFLTLGTNTIDANTNTHIHTHNHNHKENLLKKNTSCNTRDNSAEHFGLRAFLATGSQHDVNALDARELASFHRALQQHEICTSTELCMAVCLAKRYKAALHSLADRAMERSVDAQAVLPESSLLDLEPGCWDLGCKVALRFGSDAVNNAVDGKMRWVACVMLACKLSQDEPYDNAAFARVSEIPLRILNQAEKKILQTLGYAINIRHEEYENVRTLIPEANATDSFA